MGDGLDSKEVSLIIGGAFTGLVVASLLALHLGKVVVPRVGEWEAPPRILVDEFGPVTVEQVRKAIVKLEAIGHVFGPVSTTRSSAMVPGAIVVGLQDAKLMAANRIASATWATAFEFGEFDEDLGEAPELKTDARDVLGPVDVLGRILHAYIGIDPVQLEGRDPVQVLAHELAHALGFLHTETAVLGRKREKPSEEEVEAAVEAGEPKPKAKKGKARLGLVGRKTGHLMNPVYEKGGWNTAGMEIEALDSERQKVRRRRGRK